ncbi:uncharacterized protein LOC120359730 [Solenopsis invicta]|uniref:uncharacterized protein LOC120359730 n=1 Tax=Solenopsis invicta TaxID=13686 RepID=UPI00193C8CAD|nr:uncharacterized protein LOC120359730 [Solenopsis invicta]
MQSTCHLSIITSKLLKILKIKKMSTPGILDGELFRIIPDSQNRKENSTQVIAECVSCGNKYSGALNATGNFYTHIKRKHLSLLKKALEKKEAKYKNASSCETSNLKPLIPAKQPKLMNTNMLVKNTVSKEQVIKLVLSYIINEMRPLAIVEKPSFRNLISGISNVELPTRKTLKKKIEEQFESTIAEIKIRVSKTQFVCTTADIWSCTN